MIDDEIARRMDHMAEDGFIRAWGEPYVGRFVVTMLNGRIYEFDILEVDVFLLGIQTGILGIAARSNPPNPQAEI